MKTAFFDLCDPYVTFGPKLVMSQVRVGHTLVIVTTAGQIRYGMFEILACWQKKKKDEETDVIQDPAKRRQDNNSDHIQIIQSFIY